MDDFLWCLMKGCVQLRLILDINNTVNMVLIDHVARCTALTAVALLSAPRNAVMVLHVAADPCPAFNGFLGVLVRYGFRTERIVYLLWCRELERHVMDAQNNTLSLLQQFVLDDLPTSMKAPELSDANMRALLGAKINWRTGPHRPAHWRNRNRNLLQPQYA